MAREQYWGILNTSNNKMLTSYHEDRSVWDRRIDAGEIMQNEFGGGDHLEVVKVIRER